MISILTKDLFMGTLLWSSLISCLISFVEISISIAIWIKKFCWKKSRVGNYITNQNISAPQNIQNENAQEIIKVTENNR